MTFYEITVYVIGYEDLIRIKRRRHQCGGRH